MSSQISHTTDSVALDLNVWAEHLPNQRFQAAEFDDQQFVIRYSNFEAEITTKPNDERAPLTVHGQIAEGCAGGSLHFCVMTAEEEQDGV
jgi:hypothetical protein